MLPAKSTLGAVFLVTGLSAVPASAALVTFSGEDIMPTTSSPHPVSAAAAASFDAAVTALGGGSLVTFESAPLGSFSNLTIAPGVTMNGTDSFGANQTIRNTSNFPAAPQLDGYNTTPGGVNFVEMLGGNLTFSFANPIEAFGAYFSGIQTNFFADSITFSNGTSQTLLIPGAGTNSSTGALDFVGFTDVGKSITSVTVTAGSPTAGDFIGVDDVRFQAAPVPEPASLAIFGTALAGFGLMRRRRRIL
jgi:PEP-CTERM motif